MTSATPELNESSVQAGGHLWAIVGTITWEQNEMASVSLCWMGRCFIPWPDLLDNCTHVYFSKMCFNNVCMLWYLDHTRSKLVLMNRLRQSTWCNKTTSTCWVRALVSSWYGCNIFRQTRCSREWKPSLLSIPWAVSLVTENLSLLLHESWGCYQWWKWMIFLCNCLRWIIRNNIVSMILDETQCHAFQITPHISQSQHYV